MFVCLLIIGYRPIKISGALPDWEALSALSTLSAVIIALFITKWQDWINNRKELKIEFCFIENTGTVNMFYKELSQEHKLDGVCFRFVNTGNRRIIIDHIVISFSKEWENHLIPGLITPFFQQPQVMKLPYSLEPEETTEFYIPAIPFSEAIIKFLKDGKVNEKDDIIIKVTDTAKKEYIHNTKQKYGSFLKKE